MVDFKYEILELDFCFQAIIIEPSRELAEQTLKQIQMFKKHLVPPAVTELLVVGGISINDQVAALNSGIISRIFLKNRTSSFLSNLNRQLYATVMIKGCREKFWGGAGKYYTCHCSG